MDASFTIRVVVPVREIIDPKSGLGLVEASPSLEMSNCVCEVRLFLYRWGSGMKGGPR